METEDREVDQHVAIYNRILALQALLESKIDRISDVNNTRLDALCRFYEAEFKALRVEVTSYVALSDSKLEIHTAESDRRFESVQLRFSERDERFKLAALDNAKANDKSEALAISQIKQLAETLNVALTNINKQIDDTKDRITRAEGYAKGAGGLWTALLSGVSAAIAVGTFLIIVFHLKGTP